MLKKAVWGLVALNLILNIFGNTWGLPARWNSDEIVANVLHMADRKTLVDPLSDFVHPTGYNLFLLILLVPVFLFLKVINYPLAALKIAASISWANTAVNFPGFATGIFIYARTISAILGALSVYMVYLLGKEVHNEKSGFFSAVFLSVCAGFIGVNHFAKYISLVNLLIIIVLLMCAKAINASDEKKFIKYMQGGFLFAGLATSVQVNSPLLLLPLCFSLFLGSRGGRMVIKTVKCTALFLAGFIVGTPAILRYFYLYITRITACYGNNFSLNYTSKPNPLVVSVNYFFEILSICGIGIFIFVCAGILMSAMPFKRISKKELFLLFFIFPYYLVIAFLFRDEYPTTKNIIAIVPVLMVFAGHAMENFLVTLKRHKLIGIAVFFTIFIYSLSYCIKADVFFVKGDTRYASTKWIYDNIPAGSKIEVFDQLNYVSTDTIIKDYEIIFLGTSSRLTQEKDFLWVKVDGRQDYLRFINKEDSSSDYIILDLNKAESLYRKDFLLHLPGLAEYLRDLFAHKKNFMLVKVFMPTNQLKRNKYGFTVFANLFWDPIPVYRDTAMTIYVFKRYK